MLRGDEGDDRELSMRFNTDTNAVLISMIRELLKYTYTIIIMCCLHCIFIVVNVMVHCHRSGDILNNGLDMGYLICDAILFLS